MDKSSGNATFTFSEETLDKESFNSLDDLVNTANATATFLGTFELKLLSSLSPMTVDRTGLYSKDPLNLKDQNTKYLYDIIMNSPEILKNLFGESDILEQYSYRYSKDDGSQWKKTYTMTSDSISNQILPDNVIDADPIDLKGIDFYSPVTDFYDDMLQNTKDIVNATESVYEGLEDFKKGLSSASDAVDAEDNSIRAHVKYATTIQKMLERRRKRQYERGL